MTNDKGEAKIDNNIPKGDVFNYHPLRNATFILSYF